ncbi:hypothetical protein EJP82_25460 [Paenibacillus anaericanus]|uniref:Uncharacterized protein n=2 Tax=Paenibacillus anaericanus TaxID=170367 RepID=A0A3S1BF88_9BACL|nr:hypothetical protein EJP82_25460 [Paenibacillus anaericanus]
MKFDWFTQNGFTPRIVIVTTFDICKLFPFTAKKIDLEAIFWQIYHLAFAGRCAFTAYMASSIGFFRMPHVTVKQDGFAVTFALALHKDIRMLQLERLFNEQHLEGLLIVRSDQYARRSIRDAWL